MNEDEVAEGSTGPQGSVFLRLGRDLVEVDREGWVPRQVLLTSDGRPREAIGPPNTTPFEREFGYDYDERPPAPPGTAEFDEFWGSGTIIDREEFERIFARAKANPVRFRDYPRDDKTAEVVARLIPLVAFAIFVVVVHAIWH